MYLADSWHDYEIIDAGDGEKLERWGGVTLLRPAGGMAHGRRQ